MSKNVGIGCHPASKGLIARCNKLTFLQIPLKTATSTRWLLNRPWFIFLIVYKPVNCRIKQKKTKSVGVVTFVWGKISVVMKGPSLIKLSPQLSWTWFGIVDWEMLTREKYNTNFRCYKFWAIFPEILTIAELLKKIIAFACYRTSKCVYTL